MFKLLMRLIFILFVFFTSFMPAKEASAIGIIGGADGPTAIFIASKTNHNSPYMYLIVGALCISMALFIWKKRDSVK